MRVTGLIFYVFCGIFLGNWGKVERKGKPVVRRGRKARGLTEKAQLPNRQGQIHSLTFVLRPPREPESGWFFLLGNWNFI